jgi:5-methylcytosine-specific restriction enzyme A
VATSNWSKYPSRSNNVTATARWRRLRLRVLKRDGYICQMGLPGCTLEATQVDHVLSIAQGGNPFAEDQCRSVCARCHLAKSSQEAARGRGRHKRTPPVHPADALSQKTQKRL